MPDTRQPRRKTPVDHDPRALREARIRAGLRQGDLARELNISQSLLSEAETGTRGINPALRVRLAKFLGCDPISFAPLQVRA
ncbi:helix-turn-helix domain-containing protein [Actinoplanes sp. CA-142083]|uniref:helix-turn-helix domain-containing protein n=1 Tax=Actinoplanes sp. CA-142083 TaxID=3239903 RepID=UPI003D92D222